jgi:predicted MPP superfamily phosphohydrolase
MPLTRRQFLERATLGAAAVGVAGSGGLAVFDTRDVEVTRQDLVVPNLPPSLEGHRLAQVTDVHLPYNRAPAERTLELLAEIRPELLAITGDLIEGRHALPYGVEFARAAAATARATWFVMGNWEYVSHIRADVAERELGRVGVEVLVNRPSAVRVPDGALTIFGLDDPFGRGADARAAAAIEDAAPIVWLLHEPGYVAAVPKRAGNAVVLSGHTHGGQIRLPFVPAVTPPGSGPFVEGWYREGAAPLYVCRGIGTTSIRFRFRCRAELSVFTLRRGAAPA